MGRPPETPPPLRWAVTFSTAFLDGRLEWRVGSLYLDRPDFYFLRNSDGKIEEGRHLRPGERISTGNEMVLLDCVVRVGARVLPDRRRLTLAPGDLSPAMAASSSGSRFNVLAELQVGEDGDEASAVDASSGKEHVAMKAASMILSDGGLADGGAAWSTVSRRRKTKEELVQEFWEDVGFPTPASRVWERPGSSSPTPISGQVRDSSISTNGLPSQCRTPPVGVDVYKPPAAARHIRRGVLIRPWKGPLPRPRPMQPVALAAFMPPPSSDGPAADNAQRSLHDPRSAATCSASVTPNSTLPIETGRMGSSDGGSSASASQMSGWPCHVDFSLRGGVVRAWALIPTCDTLPSPSRLPPPPPLRVSYAAAVRVGASAGMSGRLPSSSKGGPPAMKGTAPSSAVVSQDGPVVPSQSRFTGFGPTAGPPRTGASGQAPPAAAPLQQPMLFGVPTAAAAPPTSSRPSNNNKKKKRKGTGRVPASTASGPPLFVPVPQATPAAPVLPGPVSAGTSTVSPAAQIGGKKISLWCYKCRTDDHLSKDCNVTHFCYICNNYKHPLHRCSVLKQSRPMAAFGGVGLNEAMFVHLPDSVFKEHLAPSSSPIGLVMISGGSVTGAVVEAEIAKIASVQTSWKWEAVPHGDDAFLVAFPSMEVLRRVSAFEFKVKSHNVLIAISEWKSENDVKPTYNPLKPVWVHVTGVPPPLRHFLGLWAVGSVIGATQDVDLICLRRRGIVRIQVAVLNLNIFKKEDNTGSASVSAGMYVKLNGYDFRFVLEKDDFKPDDDFIPRIWEHQDDGPDHGANRDDDLPDQDANKKAKNSGVSGAASSESQSDGTVPMNTDVGFAGAQRVCSDSPMSTIEESRTTSTPSIDVIHADNLEASVGGHDSAHAGLGHPKRVAALQPVEGEFGPPAQGLAEAIGSGACPATVHGAADVYGAADLRQRLDVSVQQPDDAAVSPPTQARQQSPMLSHGAIPMAPSVDLAAPTSSSTPTMLVAASSLSTDRPMTPMALMSEGSSPLRRSNRHPVSVDGSSPTDEHAMDKAMRRQAARNLDTAPGYFPLYALASYVVYATTSGVPTAVQGGVYAVGAGGYGGFYPTWVAA